MNKLTTYGIRGLALDWVRSFLSERRQYVNVTYSADGDIGRAQSESLEVNIGVPQGSVLGPVLFLLYVNEVDTLANEAAFTMYADDMSLIISSKLDVSLKAKCDNVLGSLHNWYCLNTLYFNTDKTEFMRFHNRQKICDVMQLSINNMPLTQSKSVRFLGVILDECLNWKDHCRFIIAKLNSLTYLFMNLRNILSKEQLLCLYHAQVESRIRYNICFWGNSTLSSNVFRSQKQILRCIEGVRKTHSCKDIFKKYQLLSFFGLYIFELCVYVYANVNNFKTNEECHLVNTRNKKELHIPFCKYDLTSCSPNYMGPKIFNHLPNNLKGLQPLGVFKRELKCYLVDKCPYSVSDYVDLCR